MRVFYLKYNCTSSTTYRTLVPDTSLTTMLKLLCYSTKNSVRHFSRVSTVFPYPFVGRVPFVWKKECRSTHIITRTLFSNTMRCRSTILCPFTPLSFSSHPHSHSSDRAAWRWRTTAATTKFQNREFSYSSDENIESDNIYIRAKKKLKTPVHVDDISSNSNVDDNDAEENDSGKEVISSLSDLNTYMETNDYDTDVDDDDKSTTKPYTPYTVDNHKPYRNPNLDQRENHDNFLYPKSSLKDFKGGTSDPKIQQWLIHKDLWAHTRACLSKVDNPLMQVDTGLSIITLGTGSGLPSLVRSSSATVIKHGGNAILIDCGEGTQKQFMWSRLNFRDVNTILSTLSLACVRLYPLVFDSNTLFLIIICC